MPEQRFAEMTVEGFLDAVAAKTPAPGGGAVAGATAALGAALARMVLAYSLGKKSLAAHEGALREADEALARLRVMFLALGDEDAAAYALVNELRRLAPDDPRRAGLAAAEKASLDVPRTVLGACVEMLRRLEGLAGITNPHLRSDLAIAGVLGEAGARAAWWNVRVNAGELEAGERARVFAEIDDLHARAAALRARIEAACGGGGGSGA